MGSIKSEPRLEEASAERRAATPTSCLQRDCVTVKMSVGKRSHTVIALRVKGLMPRQLGKREMANHVVGSSATVAERTNGMLEETKVGVKATVRTGVNKRPRKYAHQSLLLLSHYFIY